MIDQPLLPIMLADGRMGYLRNIADAGVTIEAFRGSDGEFVTIPCDAICHLGGGALLEVAAEGDVPSPVPNSTD